MHTLRLTLPMRKNENTKDKRRSNLLRLGEQDIRRGDLEAYFSFSLAFDTLYLYEARLSFSGISVFFLHPPSIEASHTSVLVGSVWSVEL